MSTTKSFTRSDYLWILGITAAVLACIPLIAAFGVVLQVAFVAIMPVLLLGTLVNAIFSRKEVSVLTVQGVDVPENLPLSPSHAWARRESNQRVVTGIDDFAQRVVGEVEAVETGAVGTKVEEGDVVAVLHHTGREIPMRAPVPGTIHRVNAALETDPGLVNRSPYENGWIVELEPEASSLKTELANLLGGGNAVRWMRGEVDRLVALTSPLELGPTMADGGELGHDLSEHFDEATWRKVKSEFFS